VETDPPGIVLVVGPGHACFESALSGDHRVHSITMQRVTETEVPIRSEFFARSLLMCQIQNNIETFRTKQVELP